MTKREKEVIEVFRLHMCTSTAEDVQHDSYPEEIGVPNGKRPCDAIWRGPCGRYAIEHTTIDRFLEQRKDDDRFRKVMGALEKSWLHHPNYWLEVAINVGAIPEGRRGKRIDWETLSEQIKKWLLENASALPLDTQHRVQIPGIPFDLWVRRELVSEEGRLIVMRVLPNNLEQQRVEVIRKALDSKSGVLGSYKSRGFSTILLLEYFDIPGNRSVVFEALHKAYRPESDFHVYDQIFLAMTGTRPWCIMPFKVGQQLIEEPDFFFCEAPYSTH